MWFPGERRENCRHFAEVAIPIVWLSTSAARWSMSGLSGKARRKTGMNMLSYAAFAVSAIAIYRGWRVPLLIAWFFALMGAMGNAIGHIVYDVISGDLGFPGFYTSLGYWVIGLILVYRLWTAVHPQDAAPAQGPRDAQDAPLVSSAV